MAFVFKEERKFKTAVDNTGDHIGPGTYAVAKKVPIKENFAPFKTALSRGDR
jgi:hypothetical protein